jgi:hypothetical protein
MLKNVIQNAIQEIPAIALRKLVLRKAKESGIKTPGKFTDALVAHLLSRNNEEFIWNPHRESKSKNFDLNFSAEDINELDANVKKIIEALPTAIAEASNVASNLYFDSLCESWADESGLQLEEIGAFRDRLEDRWGTGLSYLRLLLTCCREMGGNAFKRHKKSKSSRHHYRRWVLLRLHVRACQVTDEVICLMENGFADGALARWRTLHEIAVVSVIIADGDETLAERYILHDDVEVKRQADDYDINQVPLGFSPIRKRERSAIERSYKRAIDRFGQTFASPYGWAADALSLKKPTFKDLQEKAGHQSMNSYYKLASFNVHAGARSLFFNLSSIDSEEILLAGRSNAGLVEPGVRAAQSLVLVTGLYAAQTNDLDRLTEFKAILSIRDAVMPALKSADAVLHDDEMARRASLAKQRLKKQAVNQP